MFGSDVGPYWGAITQIIPVLCLALMLELRHWAGRLRGAMLSQSRWRVVGARIWFMVVLVAVGASAIFELAGLWALGGAFRDERYEIVIAEFANLAALDVVILLVLVLHVPLLLLVNEISVWRTLADPQHSADSER